MDLGWSASDLLCLFVFIAWGLNHRSLDRLKCIFRLALSFTLHLNRATAYWELLTLTKRSFKRWVVVLLSSKLQPYYTCDAHNQLLCCLWISIHFTFDLVRIATPFYFCWNDWFRMLCAQSFRFIFRIIFCFTSIGKTKI